MQTRIPCSIMRGTTAWKLWRSVSTLTLNMACQVAPSGS